MAIGDRLKHAWNAFTNRGSETFNTFDRGTVSSGRPDRVRLSVSNERSIIAAIYVRIAIDAASAEFRHVRLDEDGRYLEDLNTGLQNCLTVEANLDQGARDFRQDIVMTMLDRGVAAVVPVDTTTNPAITGSFDIKTMRVGDIVQFQPKKIRVNLYNEETGRREEIPVDKQYVAIIPNPLYSVMNEPSSTLQRLIRKLNLLDFVDEQSSSGKLDIIIQLPYTVKTEARREQARQRREEIAFQLKDNQYGIAYADATEKITQLNRPAENNLLKQIEMLKDQLYTELGMTPEVMNGTADEATMLNYYNRTIEPILTTMSENMRRAFITKTGRTQRQAIMFFRNPFKFVPLSQIAEIADKLGRNEVTSSNEIRGFIGMKPSKDPKADQLRNSNMPQSELGQDTPPVPPTPEVPVDPQVDVAAQSALVHSVSRRLDTVLAMPISDFKRNANSVGVGTIKNQAMKGDSQNGSSAS